MDEGPKGIGAIEIVYMEEEGQQAEQPSQLANTDTVYWNEEESLLKKAYFEMKLTYRGRGKERSGRGLSIMLWRSRHWLKGSHLSSQISWVEVEGLKWGTHFVEKLDCSVEAEDDGWRQSPAWLTGPATATPYTMNHSTHTHTPAPSKQNPDTNIILCKVLYLYEQETMEAGVREAGWTAAPHRETLENADHACKAHVGRLTKLHKYRAQGTGKPMLSANQGFKHVEKKRKNAQFENCARQNPHDSKPVEAELTGGEENKEKS
ncbi:hypothetical protein F5148DRAFT_1148814 [Russula earlei]|uniref:Uncharacterized protein n=1 Tax=Russula earlei TaxID=71964 RepID=A0ACC0UBK7_9AGAM|nr:hypothetical protein F5148DRAFT_1148814 [Russula earlei]